MNARRVAKIAGGGLLVGGAIGVLGYAALILLNRARYGHPKRVEDDPVLDRFMPHPEVSERHEIEIHAPVDIVMATAKSLDLFSSPLIRTIIRARELALGGKPDPRPLPAGLYDQMRAIGWGLLSERDGREVVLGAVTQPWVAAPEFRAIPPDAFDAFGEPGFVKIVWTLRVDPVDDERSLFHTETRVCTTDAAARKRFREYWSFVAPGIKLIRVALLQPLRRAAEQRVKADAAAAV